MNPIASHALLATASSAPALTAATAAASGADNPCVALHHGLPPGIGAWLRAVAEGADPVALAESAMQAARAAAATPQGRGVWITLCPSEAWQHQLGRLRRRIDEAGSMRAAIERHPLLGVPFVVKDNIDVEGADTTAACPAWRHPAPRSATAVQRLLDAGALWLGKTNLDQFATGLVGTRSPFGRPSCVDDAARISGGSSSGSAVAVARGWAAFALGTDTAGSGRIPAGFNGLVGLKPTPGRVSTCGVLPACRTLDCVSIFAREVADAAHVLAVVEGADAGDDQSRFEPGPADWTGTPRIGVPRAPVFFGDAGYPPAWSAARSHLEALGHAVVEVDFSVLDEVAALLYEGPWVAERHAVVQALLARDPQALDATVRQVIGRAEGMTATQAFQAQYRLAALRKRVQAMWQDIDVLVVPTAPGHPTFEELDADPVGVNARLGAYTNFVNLLGWCALALPCGRTARGLPFGITLIAPAAHDAALAALGRRLIDEPAPEWPARGPATEPTLAIAAVGAHLSGLPLNGQLTERGARLTATTETAPRYRLFELPGTVPPKPGLVRVAKGEGGARAIEVEVWELPQREVGSFLALIPPPLGLGSIELADGRWVHGFVCESHAVQGARDISAHGGWRAWLIAKAKAGAGARTKGKARTKAAPKARTKARTEANEKPTKGEGADDA